jgi:K+-transporting ATPase ATPase A chain
MSTVLIVIVASLALSLPLARWLHIVASQAPSPLDRVFDPLDAVIHRLIGWDSAAPMGWRLWARWILATNALLGAAIYLIFLTQGALPLNPDGVGGMDWELALHTASSFVTNTNQQHYSGQAQLSYLAQLAAVVTAQFVTPAIGLAAMLATVRGLAGGAPGGRRDAWGDVDLGNAWARRRPRADPRARAPVHRPRRAAHLAGRARHPRRGAARHAARPGHGRAGRSPWGR